MRRGCTLSAIYFHSFPYTGDRTKEKVLDLARKLAPWHGPFLVHVVGFTEAQKTLREHGPGDLAVLLYRRMMMRVASRIALGERAKALITGENLGQVASQTLENLAVIEDAATLPVLRPLLTYDKLEIIEKAQAIGTYDLSIQPYDDTCQLFVPRHPATRARIKDLVAAERGLDVDAIADDAASRAERIEIR
jgi:thiamine biosynthesis protein ThiI